MVELVAYVHHIRGHVITLKTFRRVKAGGGERREYAHISLSTTYHPKSVSHGKPNGTLVDIAVENLNKWCVATIDKGQITGLRLATDNECKEYRD